MKKPLLVELPLTKLQPGKYQPRKQFDTDSLQELSNSIKANGLIQPIVVRPVSDDQYEIIAGERRWRACAQAGQQLIPCLVNSYNDEQAAEAAAVENINRVDLNPIEEALAYQRLLDDFDYLHEEVAAAIGKSRVTITNALRLLKLAPFLQQAIISGDITEGHGKVLASLPIDKQNLLGKQCLQKKWSIRSLDREVKDLLNNKQKPIKSNDPDLKALENSLSSHLGSSVNIQATGSQGKLVIDFHNLDILEGIFDKMQFKNRESSNN